MKAHILVPLDGTARAESALPLEAALARLTASGIVLLMAVPGAVAEGTADLREVWEDGMAAAQGYLQQIAERLEQAGLQVRVEIVEKVPAAAIIEYARQDPGVWLIALTTRHLTPPKPWAYGNITERVLYSAPRPVLLVRPVSEEPQEQEPEEPALRTIIVPLDGSKFAEKALDEAKYLATLTGATLALVSVIPPRNYGEIDQAESLPPSASDAREYERRRLAAYLAGLADSLREEGLQVRTELVFGHPAEMILLVARRLGGDLIVMATHGPSNRERLWLGSVAQKLVQASTVPVLLIKATGSGEKMSVVSYQPLAANSNGAKIER